MAKKRKNGEGTVRLRKDGRWEGRVVIGYDDKGLPKTKNVLAKTKLECVEKLKALKNTVLPPAPEKIHADISFGKWVEHWYEIMMDKYDKEEMLSDVREAMLYQLGADVSCEELNHFFTGKGKAALSGCAEWQQCFAVEKMLEFYYVHARDETLAKQIETMTMPARQGDERHG